MTCAHIQSWHWNFTSFPSALLLSIWFVNTGHLRIMMLRASWSKPEKYELKVQSQSLMAVQWFFFSLYFFPVALEFLCVFMEYFNRHKIFLYYSFKTLCHFSLTNQPLNTLLCHDIWVFFLLYSTSMSASVRVQTNPCSQNECFWGVCLSISH